jgi:hypothetical protein
MAFNVKGDRGETNYCSQSSGVESFLTSSRQLLVPTGKRHDLATQPFSK